jgi:putative colanic acid biosynthesis UDP-glucose lipid carrier transferase
MEQVSSTAATLTLRQAHRSRYQQALPGDVVQLVVGFLRAADIAIVPIAALQAFYLRYRTFDFSSELVVLVLLGTGAMVNVMSLLGAYDARSLLSLRHQILKVFAAWAAIIVGLLSFVFFSHLTEQVARLWVVYWAGSGILLMTAMRHIVRSYIGAQRRMGKLAINVAVVGPEHLAQKIVRRLTASEREDVNIVGIFHLGETGGADAGGVPVENRGSVAELCNIARKVRVDEVVIAVPEKVDATFNSAVRRLSTLPTNINLCPDLFDVVTPPRKVKILSDTLMINVCERPLAGWASIVKRVEDIVLSSLLLVFFFPLMAMIALLIKLDSKGPVLFKQQRFGFNNDTITVLKFRTMRQDTCGDGTVPQAQQNDPRVTRVGRILRRTSLDELPQLINVLMGDMSLIGPRPHAVAHNEHYAKIIDGYLARHRVRPGITGWAQVNGYRGETKNVELMIQRVKHDLYYIDNWSLWLDIRILLKSVLCGFVHPNAY